MFLAYTVVKRTLRNTNIRKQKLVFLEKVRHNLIQTWIHHLLQTQPIPMFFCNLGFRLFFLLQNLPIICYRNVAESEVKGRVTVKAETWLH